MTGDGGPAVVVVGGGHGAAAALRAVRRYAGTVSAVISVADDGGSSGRLRQLMDVVALGDLRKCLVALADDALPLTAAFEHRFAGGELDGHALGNLVLAALSETCGDLVAGVDAAARLLGACGRVLPATTERVILKALAQGGEVAGQVAVSATGHIDRVSLVPDLVSSPPQVVEVLRDADQVVLGPGSLFTSVLAAAAVPAVRDALAHTPAPRIYVCNLHPELPETAGYDVAAHVRALARHGVEVDVVLCDDRAQMPVGSTAVPVVRCQLTGSNPRVHDPARLSDALMDLVRGSSSGGGARRDAMTPRRGGERG